MQQIQCYAYQTLAAAESCSHQRQEAAAWQACTASQAPDAVLSEHSQQMQCCQSTNSRCSAAAAMTANEPRHLLGGSSYEAHRLEALLTGVSVITGAWANGNVCRGLACIMTAAHLTDESDHSRSATAAARGQVRAMLLVASTFSPHMQASPPITRSCW